MDRPTPTATGSAPAGGITTGSVQSGFTTPAKWGIVASLLVIQVLVTLPSVQDALHNAALPILGGLLAIAPTVLLIALFWKSIAVRVEQPLRVWLLTAATYSLFALVFAVIYGILVHPGMALYFSPFWPLASLQEIWCHTISGFDCPRPN